MPRLAPNAGLTALDLARLDHAELIARRAGKPLRWFMTLSPARRLNDNNRRKLFSDLGNRFDKLFRGGVGHHVGLFVREHPRHDPHDVGLHQHNLAWLAEEAPEDVLRALTGTSERERRGDKLIAANGKVNVAIQRHEGEEGIRQRLKYLKKGRNGQHQGWLASRGKLAMGNYWRWEPQRPLLGARWGMSKALKVLVAEDAAQTDQRAERLASHHRKEAGRMHDDTRLYDDNERDLVAFRIAGQNVNQMLTRG